MDGMGLGIPRLVRRGNTAVEQVLVQRPLQRVLAFLGRSIDDVINDPVCRNQVRGYYKLSRQVMRTCEIVDLERWWNGKNL